MHIFRRFLKECGFKAVSEVSGLTFIYPVNTLRPVVFICRTVPFGRISARLSSRSESLYSIYKAGAFLRRLPVFVLSDLFLYCFFDLCDHGKGFFLCCQVCADVILYLRLCTGRPDRHPAAFKFIVEYV